MKLLIGFKNPLPSELIKIFKMPIKLELDKKIKFSKQNKNWIQNLNENSWVNNNVFYNNKYSLIGLIFYIIQKKDLYDESVLLNLINIYNDNNYQNNNIFDLLSKNNSIIYQDNLLEIENEMNLITETSFFYNFLWDAEFIQKLVITSICTILESNDLSHSYLIEIEKCNLENRQLNEIISLYINFMNNRNLKEGKVDNLFVDIFYLTNNLNYDIIQAKKKLLLYFKIEDKINNKHLLYNETIKNSLNTIRNDIERIKYLINEINLKLIDLNKLFLEDDKVKIDYKLEKDFKNYDLENIFKNITYTILYSISKVKIKNKVLELKKKKKGFKISESFNNLINLLNIKDEEIEILVNDNNVSACIKNILSVRNRLNYDIKHILDENMKSKNDERRKPKLPKGTKDYSPKQMAIKNYALKIIKNVFTKHGAVEIDTPVFELRETLLGKYGEEGGKLIYNLEDQGGELLSLRYDLTVPFARYMGLSNTKKIKRYHISKVYRRDQPAIERGRFREFYQCDFDIAGKYEKMVPDAEILKIIIEILELLEIGKFKLKFSHKLLLEAIIEESGCDMKKFKSICSSIDKLDKEDWCNIKVELMESKGLKEEQVDNLYKFITINGDIDSVLKAINETSLSKNPKGKLVVEEINILKNYLLKFNCLDKINFDLSLARGLDYYTGLIFEAVLLDSNMGSISGGGRYDNLIGMNSKDSIPSVGMSIGIERIFVILEKKIKDKIKTIPSKVYIAVVGKNNMNLTEKKLEIANLLWSLDIPTEYSYESKNNLKKEIMHCDDNKIKNMIILGEDELKNNKLKLKYIDTQEEISVDYDCNFSKIILKKLRLID